MAEVEDDLVPGDGFTNSSIQFAGFDSIEGTGGGTFRFNITDENQNYLATFEVCVGVQPEGTIDAMMIEAHRRMRDVLRQWLHGVHVMHKHYSER
jgi:hypothetical protein